MPGNDLPVALLNTGAFMVCVSFLAYVVLIVIPYMRHDRGEPGDSSEFAWHLIIPCLDEELVITPTVEALVRSFPRAQVWCVDDASADATPVLLARLAERFEQVHVVTRRFPDAHRGKGPALNAGWAAISAAQPTAQDRERVIVGVVDADGRLDPGCLDAIVGAEFFANPEVGAVQIQVRVGSRPDLMVPGVARRRRRPPRLLVRLQDLEFTGPIAAMQLLRRRVGSVGMGGNGQFSRLAILDRIAADHGTPWHGALLEDFELGLHVLLSGSRTEYCNDTFVAQEGLVTLRHLIRQRSRWAQGSMQCFRYLGPVLRSPKIATRAAMEIAYFLMMPWLELLGGLVYLGASVLTIWYALHTIGGPVGWFSGGAWGIVPLFVLFGLAPFLVWGPIHRARTDPSVTRPAAIGLGFANFTYSYLHHVAVWWAFGRCLLSRRDWKKSDRTARPLPVEAALGYAPLPVVAGAALAMSTEARSASSPSIRPSVHNIHHRRAFGVAHRTTYKELS